ncbi:tetraacyldisaccharide 4'-kinase [Catenovulum adriaticum]|uniref:Tetraacyldisaccharide 4'-kinase n=1 Tax=Catenovulum adriaticum TaxID=2984846 RepID=A0ABY7ANR1_9ALTE|nr:tetraacyldisaccharide 4'-kinase [Catenovulum sp. TS8]WAJ71195.1 tetraacyldisaccharide 4'-kinase [Catenovulum sp. TS8]
MNWFEKGWYKQHKFIYLLLPLTALFWALSAIRRGLFKYGLKKTYKASAPVIVVGNITVGGTGKTPFVIWLTQHLIEQGFKPGIINRGYGSQVGNQNVIVSAKDNAVDVGDEAKLISLKAQVPVAVGANRIKSAELLLAQGCDILLCDDGLQHYKLQRDLEIILVDGSRQLGNQCLLPAGPLREGKWRLKTTDFVIQNGLQPLVLTDYYFSTQAQVPKPVLINNSQPFDYQLKYDAVCAIGNPQRFYQSLADKKIQLLEKYTFIDHHQFSLSDFSQCEGAGIIMTEKDAVKCNEFAQSNWWYLPISIQPDQSFIQKLDQQIINLRKQYGL